MSNTNELKTIKTLEKVKAIMQEELDAIGKEQGRIDWKEDWNVQHEKLLELEGIIDTLEFEYNVLIAVCE
jgi:hypothetical protein